MPGFDRTGPQGKGSMTGRRRGNCSGVIPAQKTIEAKPADSTNEILGVGRGGRPRGGSQGKCFGGGRRRFNNQ